MHFVLIYVLGLCTFPVYRKRNIYILGSQSRSSLFSLFLQDAKKGLLVVQMSAGTEENADEMLTIAASTKCVLVTDVHLAPPSWFLTIPPKIQHATDNGILPLLSLSLPSPFPHSCGLLFPPVPTVFGP